MVEWKKLGEIVKRNKGIPITAGQMSELNSPNGNVRVFAAGQTIADIDEDQLPQGCAYTKPSVVVKSRGYIDFEFYDKPFTHKSEMWSYSFEDINLCKYVYYYLTTKTEEFRKKAKTNSVKLPQLCVADTDKYQIPIPSLSEQKRIVGILDTFTDSIENLKKQIEQRRKQYAYLIDNFFGGSLNEMKKKAENGTLQVEPLSAHGTFTRGRRFVRTDVVEEGQPCIHYGDMYTYYGLYADKANTHLPYDFPKKMRYAKKGDVVIVGAGENNEDIAVGLVWFGDEPAAVHDACYIYESDFEPMYLSYFLRSSIYHLQIKSHVVRGKICSISSDGIGKALIPIFPMEKQKEIVSKLLPFESLLKNLEAQLAQRQKQYEYYRNQLLTFE